jgi:hypothetical protein
LLYFDNSSYLKNVKIIIHFLLRLVLPLNKFETQLRLVPTPNSRLSARTDKSAGLDLYRPPVADGTTPIGAGWGGTDHQWDRWSVAMWRNLIGLYFFI